MKNTIAAIIPLYNGAEYLREAVQSVLDQERPADEVIVIDDGSTDDGKGAAIVRSMQAVGPAIRLLNKPNGGQGSARNHGIRAASSDFIALLDQDDVWYVDHLAELERPFLESESASASLGWVYSNVDRIDGAGRMVCRSFIDLLPAKEHPKRSLFACLAADMAILPSASLIRREALLAIGGFDERLRGYEDDELFIKLLCAGYRNVFIDKTLSKWRIHSRSASFQITMAQSREIFLDTMRTRFDSALVRDALVPRLIGPVTLDLISGIRDNDHQRIAVAKSHLGKMVGYLSWRRATFVRVLMRASSYGLLSNVALFLLLRIGPRQRGVAPYRLRHLLRQVVRRAFRQDDARNVLRR